MPWPEDYGSWSFIHYNTSKRFAGFLDTLMSVFESRTLFVLGKLGRQTLFIWLGAEGGFISSVVLHIARQKSVPSYLSSITKAKTSTTSQNKAATDGSFGFSESSPLEPAEERGDLDRHAFGPWNLNFPILRCELCHCAMHGIFAWKVIIHNAHIKAKSLKSIGYQWFIINPYIIG